MGSGGGAWEKEGKSEGGITGRTMGGGAKSDDGGRGKSCGMSSMTCRQSEGL